MKTFKQIRMQEAYFDKGDEASSLPKNAKAVKTIKLPNRADGDSITFYDDGKTTYMTVTGASQNSPPYKFAKKLNTSDYAKAAKEFLSFM